MDQIYPFLDMEVGDLLVEEFNLSLEKPPGVLEPFFVRNDIFLQAIAYQGLNIGYVKGQFAVN